MNVSFGKIITKNKIKTVTDKQQATADVIRHIFSIKDGDNACIQKIVRRNLSSDILITQLKDGNTKISAIYSGKGKKPKVKIPELTINNELFLMKIYKQIEKYAQECKDIAMNL